MGIPVKSLSYICVMCLCHSFRCNRQRPVTLMMTNIEHYRRVVHVVGRPVSGMKPESSCQISAISNVKRLNGEYFERSDKHLKPKVHLSILAHYALCVAKDSKQSIQQIPLVLLIRMEAGHYPW